MLQRVFPGRDDDERDILLGLYLHLLQIARYLLAERETNCELRVRHPDLPSADKPKIVDLQALKPVNVLLLRLQELCSQVI